MKLLTPTVVAFVVGASGCNTTNVEKPKVNLGEVRDAIATDNSGWSEGTLPEAHWPDSIKNLKPIRVYSHRANRVIALAQHDNIESGYYVCVLISSYLPTNNEEWTFTWVGDDIWTYERKIKANKPWMSTAHNHLNFSSNTPQ